MCLRIPNVAVFVNNNVLPGEILVGLFVVEVGFLVILVGEVNLDDLVVVVVALVTVPIVDVFILVWVSNTIKRQKN